MRAERHVSNDGGGPGDKDALSDFWLLAKELVELFVHFHSSQVNAINSIVKIFDSICPGDGA
jgi:hypothetical protein